MEILRWVIRIGAIGTLIALIILFKKILKK